MRVSFVQPWSVFALLCALDSLHRRTPGTATSLAALEPGWIGICFLTQSKIQWNSDRFHHCNFDHKHHSLSLSSLERSWKSEDPSIPLPPHPSVQYKEMLQSRCRNRSLACGTGRRQSKDLQSNPTNINKSINCMAYVYIEFPFW